MALPLLSTQNYDLIVVGGGAAGFMAAISAAEAGVSSVLLLEAASKPLQKVLISGGGRCNVTNATWDSRNLAENYPRGRLELLGPFSRFAAGHAVSWFAERGLALVEEDDGRMFPAENSSLAVIACLRNSAKAAGVVLCPKTSIRHIEFKADEGFVLCSTKGLTVFGKNILMATGSHKSGLQIASNLGHKIVSPVPSLFTFSQKNTLLNTCSGISIEGVSIKLNIQNNSYNDAGKLLLTHWGFSGPLILKMSSFAARDLYFNNYKGELVVKWIQEDFDLARQIISGFREKNPKKTIAATRLFYNLPKNLWLSLLKQSSVEPLLRWSDISLKNERSLLKTLTSSIYFIEGRGPFGEEFVTAGGVDLKDVDLSSMQSKICPGLYFAGEILNIDGLTGGFNFQHCWTSGWLSGQAIAKNMFTINS